MTAYSRLQEHLRFVGTGYFDEVQNAITSGTASTTALAGSTEAEQFHDLPPVRRHERRVLPSAAND
jgi:hypothetical protein